MTFKRHGISKSHIKKNASGKFVTFIHSFASEYDGQDVTAQKHLKQIEHIERVYSWAT